MKRIWAKKADCQTMGSSLFFLLVLLLALTACRSAEDGEIPAEATVESPNKPTEAYPAPEQPSGYPAPVLEIPSPEAYPGPTEPIGILLAFDKPIENEATVVTGVGPPGLYIQIIDITFMGPELGAGMIADDGSFEISVTGLQPGTRIGLAADLETSLYSEADVRPGSESISIPRVGYFFDSYVLIQGN